MALLFSFVTTTIAIAIVMLLIAIVMLAFMLVFIDFSYLCAYCKLLIIIAPTIQAPSHPMIQLVSQDGSNHLYISTSGQDCQLRRLTGGVHTYPDLV